LKTRLILAVLVIITGTFQEGRSAILEGGTVQLDTVCPLPQQLAVLSGQPLSALTGIPLQNIALFRRSESGLQPIIFQIDQKDQEDRYVLEVQATPGKEQLLDQNDELVFRISDAGRRLNAASEIAKLHALIEIGIVEPVSQNTSWIYAVAAPGPVQPTKEKYIRYIKDHDRVQGGIYRVDFSDQRPFLIDAFSWKAEQTGSWSPNIADTMEIEHRGKLFGLFPFLRTSMDYSSSLTAVKTGPLRIIRRTENRVRILWKLKTPALYIDYVMMPDGFFMDSIIDIPFNIGLFFDRVDTITTMNWNDSPDLPGLTIRSPYTTSELPIDGHMSPEKRAFNTVAGDRFSVSSAYGSLYIQLDIPQDFPIEPWLYLNDASNDAAPPGNRRGQFGSVGFRTTGWEKINTEVHHLKITACVETKRQGDSFRPFFLK